MSDFDAAAAALRAHLETNFTALPLRWPNDEREATLKDCPNGFVYSEAFAGVSHQIGINGASGIPWRDYGTFSVLVYVPRGTRIGAAEGYAKQIRALFGVGSVPGVIVTSKALGAGQGVDSTLGKFYCVPVTIEWFSDRTE